MTIQPIDTTPKPTGGGSFQTMFGGDYTQAAKNALSESGYNSIKTVNGVNVDKVALINNFKKNRASADQTAYKNDISILKNLGYVTSKTASRTVIEKAYVNFLTDFYSSDVSTMNDYISQRLSTSDETFTGTRATTTRQLSTPTEAADIISKAFKDYLGTTPPAKVIKSFTNELKKLESSLAARTVTTRDAQGNAVVTTTGGVATNADKESLALNFVGKVLERQGIANAGPALNAGLTAIRKTANDFGVVLSDAEIRKSALQYVRDGKLDNIDMKLKNIAKVTYPGLAQYIDAGLSVKDVASQYIAKKSQILEMPIEMLNVFDKDISRALTGQQMMNLNDFEVSLRNNPLWQYTKNAREKAANTINNILNRFGLV